MQEQILVVGAGGGIGQELVRQLRAQPTTARVMTVSRQSIDGQTDDHFQFDATNEQQIEVFCQQLREQKVTLDRVFITTGALHSHSSELSLKPEKRLENASVDTLLDYFRINAVGHLIWLKCLVRLMNKEKSLICAFSARVGSISENGLGGWYGYRASKAALNMFMVTAQVEYQRRNPNTVLLCYHPGTVDTGLSQPFQSNVKEGKLFTPEFTVRSLLEVSANLDPNAAPYYLDYKGETIPW